MSNILEKAKRFAEQYRLRGTVQLKMLHDDVCPVLQHGEGVGARATSPNS